MLYKLGAVSYWNALPLTHYLEERPVLAPPAAIARLLRIQQVDIATAPIVTLFENPSYSLVPGICIGSNGPVKSVKLFFQGEGITTENVKSIYLDMESRTSILLLKVLLKFKYGRNLDDITFFHPLPPREPGGIGGKLLIGDKALTELALTPPLDLGYEWTSWTGLPFVYAAWISRHEETSDRAVAELTEARDRGVGNLPSVVPLNPPMPMALIEAYLKQIVYHMGPREIEGIELFRDYLLKAQWIGPKIDASHLKYGTR